MQKKEIIMYAVLFLVFCIFGYLIYSKANGLSDRRASSDIVPNAPVTETGQKSDTPDNSAPSSEFKAVQAKSGEYDAFSVERGDKVYLILQKAGKETIVDQGEVPKGDDSNMFETKDFRKLDFSPNGDYLLYSVSGYEWEGSYVYDIAAGKTVIEGDGIAKEGEGFGFTPDEKYFYICNEVSGGIPGEVYAVPGFTKIFDASKGNEDYPLGKCSYDKQANAVVFTLDNPQQEDGSPLRTKTVTYSLNKDTATNPGLKITSPIKGAVWIIGKKYGLKWTPVNPKDPIGIRLYDNSAQSLAARLVWQPSDVPNTGSYTFDNFEGIEPRARYQFHIEEYGENNATYEADSEEFSISK